MTFAEPSFPPLLSGRAVVKGDRPGDLAIAGASSGDLGAGDTLWLQDATQVDLAIILEPDDALTKAAQMLPLAVAAASDSLATLTPPQVGVQCRWPATLLVNGGTVGHCSLTVPAACQPDDTPAWMVLEFALRFAFDESFEPGTAPGITSLVEEGCEEISTIDVIEAVSRHFLALLDTWTNDGFADIVQNWEGRIEGRDAAIEIAHPGGPVTARVLGLDEHGNLLIRASDNATATALALLDCLARAPEAQ